MIFLITLNNLYIGYFHLIYVQYYQYKFICLFSYYYQYNYIQGVKNLIYYSIEIYQYFYIVFIFSFYLTNLYFYKFKYLKQKVLLFMLAQYFYNHFKYIFLTFHQQLNIDKTFLLIIFALNLLKVFHLFNFQVIYFYF